MKPCLNVSFSHITTILFALDGQKPKNGSNENIAEWFNKMIVPMFLQPFWMS